MLHRKYIFIAMLLMAFVAAMPLVGAELPDYLAPVASEIEKCIAKPDNEGSRQFVSYDRLRQNWEIRWWSLLGRKEIPSEDFIRKTPDLWNAGTVVKLSLEQYCRDVSGVRLLLHGGVSMDQLKERKEYSNIQSVEFSTGKVMVGTIGDNGRPVVSVFEQIGGRWLLTDVVLQMK